MSNEIARILAEVNRRYRRSVLRERWCEAWAGVTRAIETTAVWLEVGLFQLAAELAQWPYEWSCDPHGDPDGDNPHVWFDAPRVWTHGDGNTITIRDSQCTCGLRLNAWQLEQLSRDAKIYTQGLIQRNVQ